MESQEGSKLDRLLNTLPGIEITDEEMSMLREWDYELTRNYGNLEGDELIRLKCFLRETYEKLIGKLQRKDDALFHSAPYDRSYSNHAYFSRLESGRLCDLCRNTPDILAEHASALSDGHFPRLFEDIRGSMVHGGVKSVESLDRQLGNISINQPLMDRNRIYSDITRGRFVTDDIENLVLATNLIRDLELPIDIIRDHVGTVNLFATPFSRKDPNGKIDGYLRTPFQCVNYTFSTIAQAHKDSAVDVPYELQLVTKRGALMGKLDHVFYANPTCIKDVLGLGLWNYLDALSWTADILDIFEYIKLRGLERFMEL